VRVYLNIINLLMMINIYLEKRFKIFPQVLPNGKMILLENHEINLMVRKSVRWLRRRSKLVKSSIIKLLQINLKYRIFHKNNRIIVLNFREKQLIKRSLIQ